MSILPQPPKTSAILGGMSPWQAPLAALFSGLSAAGQPGGWSNFGPAVMQANQNFAGQQMDNARFQLVQEQAAREQQRFDDEQRTANEEHAREQTTRQKLAALFAPVPSGPAGPDDRQPGQSAILGGFDPETSALLQEYAQVNPEGALNLIMERRFADPEGPESTLGKLAADLRAGRITPAEYDAAVKKENYIAYPQGPGLTERERNANAAGLQPGTQEYNDFILGRDVNSAKGPYPSNSPESTDMNNILRGQNDPTFRNSPEFIAAWNRQYEQPKIITTPDPNDPTRMVQMQITMPIPRGFQGPDYGTTPQTPGAVPPQGAASAPTAPGAPQTANASVIPGTSTVPQKEAVDLRKFEAEADAMLSALDTFDSTIAGATQVDFLDALAGGFTEGGRRLSTDWANAALLSKAESLYNLGVLNGPDLDIIRNTLTDPSTIKGQFTSIDAYKTATKSIRKLITDRINTKRSGMNLAPRDDGSDDYDSLYGLTPTE
jgi:hypothetical protein